MTLAPPPGWDLETWRPIPGFPGYEVSTRLRVRGYLTRAGSGAGRWRRRDRPTPRLLAPQWQAGCAWPLVKLFADGRPRNLSVRGLYRLAFGADPPEALRPMRSHLLQPRELHEPQESPPP